MSGITVRRVKFELPATLEEVFPGVDPIDETFLVAFSLTMPYVEPYLIRTMRSVQDRIEDPVLAEQVRAFTGQEAQHFQNHRRANEAVKALLEPSAVAELASIEAGLEADYRRFTDERSDRFNLVYAEGFEAATCAWAMANFRRAAASPESIRFGAWDQMWAWHAAEEIEHRNVAFDAYDAIAGSYVYRVVGSMRCQWHFQRYVGRLQRVLLGALGHPVRRHAPGWWRQARGPYLRTFLPGYRPGALEPEPLVDLVLAQYG